MRPRSIQAIVATALLFALSTSAVCANAADRYVLDPEHSFTIFEYSHWALSKQQGRFDKNTGFIELDTASKTGVIDVEVEAASVSTGTSIFDKTLRSDSFFDVEKFPKISFKSTLMRLNDNNKPSEIEGNLTIKGVTKSTKLEITQFNCRFMLLYLKNACGANGYTKILRSDFDMGRYAPFVSDEVTLYFIVEAIKE